MVLCTALYNIKLYCTALLDNEIYLTAMESLLENITAIFLWHNINKKYFYYTGINEVCVMERCIYVFWFENKNSAHSLNFKQQTQANSGKSL